jgi:medium-chain acyl-[acyl-carrier-protein] hydrolase
LPGRESRHGELPLRSLHSAVAEVARDVAVLPHGRVAFFGQCFGGLLAFEVSRALEAASAKEVVHLFIGSQLPPPAVAAHASDARRRNEELVTERLGAGFNPELRELVEPALVADMEALVAYTYSPGVLRSPITVFIGSEDAKMRPPDAVGWNDATSAAMRVHEMLGADRAFSGAAWGMLANEIGSRLRTVAEGSGSPPPGGPRAT